VAGALQQRDGERQRRAAPCWPAPGPEETAGEITLRRAQSTLGFWLIGIVQAATTFANQMLHVHQVAYLVDHRIPALIAASVVSVVGLASIAGEVGGGWAADFVGRRATGTIGTTCVARASSCWASSP
jgi:hypothetical protein